ncbi:restriction endonuclease subunit S domain-containing protein [Pyrinomonas methylaliphatogenes]|uniref:Restriction endonuclease S subunit n=1 Tax=Pyrinomonas methylaliphatogenes TaxID=454194 RepID=A0A0B6WVB1_9BACT|nr:restriction endonuclease subunit S [Pyrinomonas methylaliphatogenes]CDM64702.1 restriction endonuclease S subunit [Pyrinomonas methylaliphatogenes]
MWVSETHTIADLIKKGVFKSEFFDENFGASLNGVQQYELVEISQVATLRRELINPALYPEHTFNYLSLANIASDTGELVDFSPIKGREIRSQCKVFHEDDLLYGRLRPYLNKCYHAKGPVKEGVCTGECIVITPDKDKVLPEYLHALLLSKFVQEQVNYLQTGSSRPRVLEDDFMTIRIPLMPKEKQQFVANIHTSMLRLRRQKLLERSELLRIARHAIERLASGENVEDVNLLDIAVPDEPEFNNPLPQEYQASPKALQMERHRPHS